MMRNLLILINLFAVLVLTSATYAKSAAIRFVEGNDAYIEGNFTQAVDAYQQALAVQQSANAHYNLANAYYQLGNYGPAILHYEKALALEPRNPDFLANLELTQEAAELTPTAPSWYIVVANYATVNVWAWLAVISFWTFVAFLLLAPLYRWKGPLRGGVTALAFFVLLLSGIALYGWHVRGTYGVVLTDEATLSVAPTSSSPPAGAVKAGQLAQIRKRHGDFYLVTLGDKVGWLSADAFSPVWDHRS